MQMLVFMIGVVSQLTSGFWIHRFGFIVPTWFSLGCYLICGLWVIFLVPESHEKATHEKHNFFDIKSLKVLVNIFRKQREVGRKSLLLLVFVVAILTLTTMGLEGVTNLFVMRSPLCFGPKLVGYFLACRMFFDGLGGAVGVKLLGKFFSELTTCGISVVSQIVEMVFLAFATRTWLVFAGEYNEWKRKISALGSGSEYLGPRPGRSLCSFPGKSTLPSQCLFPPRDKRCELLGSSLAMNTHLS